ncbi:hypothetical protein EYF80_057110 [Liparis tanakae]|uniref:Uncharacterized protein n=1 Tax=Liparis tanakae TaxID=230148 RepID=A0A4Z2EVQ2_9TELE|nr:hypothetical protein EYF80_057110 [Liparis tanakae]
MSDYQASFKETTRLLFRLLRTSNYLSQMEQAKKPGNTQGLIRLIRSHLVEAALPADPSATTKALSGDEALHWLQTNKQRLDKRYIEGMKGIGRDLSRSVNKNIRMEWKVATNWLGKKCKWEDPEVLIKAMEVLREFGLEIGSNAPERPLPLVTGTDRPLVRVGRGGRRVKVPQTPGKTQDQWGSAVREPQRVPLGSLKPEAKVSHFSQVRKDRGRRQVRQL